MKEKKQQMSIGRQRFYLRTVAGVLWLGLGITHMFDIAWVKMIHNVILVVTFALGIYLLRADCEEDDEMSAYHYMRAKAITCDVMYPVFCVAAILASLVFSLLDVFSVNVDWPGVIVGVIFVLMGIKDLTTGIVFQRLEAE